MRLFESKVQTWEEADVLSGSSRPLMAYRPKQARQLSISLSRGIFVPHSPLSPPADATPLWAIAAAGAIV